tara:strand:- start:1873 stop:2124 length:252 start_codon:yes stop_codon:yes gene_type:complete
MKAGDYLPSLYKNIFKNLAGWIFPIILVVVLSIISYNFWEPKFWHNGIKMGNPYMQAVVVYGGPLLATYIILKLIAVVRKLIK